MKTKAIIEKGKDGTFGIFAPDLKTGIIGSGASVKEAKDDFYNSLEELQKSYTSQGKEIINELVDVEFEFKYDLASFFDFFDWINVSKLAKKIGINDSLMRHYKRGQTYISEEKNERY